MFDKPIILRVCWTLGHPTPPVRGPFQSRIPFRSLLRYRIARVDPIGVYIDRSREVVNVRLESLAADFTLQIADAGLLFDGDADGLFVIAEEALEGGGEFFLLSSC